MKFKTGEVPMQGDTDHLRKTQMGRVFPHTGTTRWEFTDPDSKERFVAEASAPDGELRGYFSLSIKPITAESETERKGVQIRLGSNAEVLRMIEIRERKTPEGTWACDLSRDVARLIPSGDSKPTEGAELTATRLIDVIAQMGNRLSSDVESVLSL